MPLYDRKCDNEACAKVFEFATVIALRNDPQPCPVCQGPTHRITLPPRGQNASHFDPVVVHRAKDGSYRFPGSADAPAPAGYERIELRTFAEIDAFSRTVSRQDRRLIDQHVENEHQQIAAMEAQHRPELRQMMQRMTPAQRRFAEVAIAHNNARRPRGYDSGFHLEMREMDASNREAHRDVRTGWKARK